MREPTKAIAVQVHSQGLVARDQNINSEIKLLAADQQRIQNVPLDNIRLSLRALWLPPELVLPLGDLLQLVEQEDAATLTLANGLHDPDPASSLEFLDEDAVFAGQVVRGREKVIRVRLLHLALTIQHLLVPLQVLYHEILSRQLIVVTKMIDALARLQVIVIQDVVDLVALHPEDIPVVALCFFVSFLPKSIKNTIPERCLELDVRGMLREVFLFYVLAEVLRHFTLFQL